MKIPNKHILPLLIFCSIFIIGMIFLGLFKVMYLGLRDIAPFVPYFFTGLGTIIYATLLLLLLNGTFMLFSKPQYCFGLKYIYRFVNFCFPFMVWLGNKMGISRREVERSFVDFNNTYLGHLHIKVRPKELLVISPHCLQLAACKYKITYDVQNCHRCGACTIGAMLKMADEMGFHFHVVTGGTLARKLVKDTRPKLVLAIACERDLASGIKDVYPLPAVGILNIRPNGPCYNTTVDLDEVRNKIKQYLKEEKEINE